MRRTLPMITTVMAIGCHAGGHTNARSGTVDTERREEIVRFERHWAEAYAKRDTAELGRLTASDYTDTDEDGMWGRAQFLTQTAGLPPAQGSFVFGEERIRVYGDMAVSTSRLRGEGDPPHTGDYFMAVFVRRDERWQVIASQLTPPRPAR